MPIPPLARSKYCGSNWCPSIPMAHTRVPPPPLHCIPHPHPHPLLWGHTRTTNPHRGHASFFRILHPHALPSSPSLLSHYPHAAVTLLCHRCLLSSAPSLHLIPPRDKVPTSLILLAPPFFTLRHTHLRSFCTLEYYRSVEALRSFLKSSSAGLATAANRPS